MTKLEDKQTKLKVANLMTRDRDLFTYGFIMGTFAGLIVQILLDFSVWWISILAYFCAFTFYIWLAEKWS